MEVAATISQLPGRPSKVRIQHENRATIKITAKTMAIMLKCCGGFSPPEIHRVTGVFYMPNQGWWSRESSFFAIAITWAYIAPVDKIVSELDSICV